MQEKIIFHADCNSFYASVELLRYPELRAKPVAVSGSEDNRHGIILAKNEAAKKFDVRTAETVWQAKQKCPDLILLPPHRSQYQKYSRIINQIYESYTDRVESFGIDESWLDMTGSWQLFGSSPLEVAHRLKEEVKAKTGITISVGVSFTKIFAKLGSDLKKPDAVTEIKKENYQDIVWPLPVNRLLYVGAKARQTLESLGIVTIGDLAEADKEMLQQVLGKQGEQLFCYARGEGEDRVAYAHEKEPVKSVGNGLTFRRNLVGEQDIKMGVQSLADEVGTRLRYYKMYAGNVQVLIKDPSFKSISRQKPLKYATNLTKDIFQVSMELMRENWDFRKPIRMLTITAGQLTDFPFAVQTSLLDEEVAIDPKQEKLETSIDKIREKFGRTAVLPAAGLHNDIGVDSQAKLQKKTKP